MAFRRYQFEIRNSAVGAGNGAFVKFDIDSSIAATPAQQVARIISYLVGPGDAAANSSIFGCTVQVNGVGTLVPVPFPVAEYAAIKAGYAFLPAMGAYSVAYGTGALTPAGTSILVDTYTNVMSRHGYGRHYRPYTSVVAVDGAGGVDGTHGAGIDEAYRATFLATPGATWTTGYSTGPLVVSATAGQNAVVNVKVSGNLANLHTRRK